MVKKVWVMYGEKRMGYIIMVKKVWVIYGEKSMGYVW